MRSRRGFSTGVEPHPSPEIIHIFVLTLSHAIRTMCRPPRHMQTAHPDTSKPAQSNTDSDSHSSPPHQQWRRSSPTRYATCGRPTASTQMHCSEVAILSLGTASTAKDDPPTTPHSPP